ncbi:TIGR03086 family metal-binding protein [Streptomyces xantholiticus]|uniref:TIGR03086 family metal-binding protein n=1 Tax=Streptomyces xantholiticus TaxID=68285 RepID=UPI001987AE3A|nr:TIGR03086 family metal-binding protein [Streptomyces xantholiticus]GGW25652.1 TIGR03086 family protein [Streptomyces xantholiticus]
MSSYGAAGQHCMDISDTTPLPDLTPAARAVTRLLGAIGDERLGDPTPCPEYAVRDLLAHIDGLSLAFRDAARKDLGPTTDTNPGAALPALDDDWRARIPVRVDELAEAWRRPEAWEGMTRAGGVDLPAAVAGRVALNELVIHGWDLARATGQEYDPGEASAAVSYEIVRPTDDDSLREGIFGPPVAVPDDASLLDRVVGLSGRRPDWRPGD